MLIRVVVTGVPDSKDRNTWPFPTAGLYSYDPVAGLAIFDVPDADMPPNLQAPGSANRPNTPVGPVQIGVQAADFNAWKATMAAKYPGWAGAFGPQVK